MIALVQQEILVTWSKVMTVFMQHIWRKSRSRSKGGNNDQGVKGFNKQEIRSVDDSSRRVTV